MDGLVGQGEGWWTPIRGFLWDCYQWAISWNICRPVIHHQATREAVGAMTGLAVRSLAVGGHATTPFEVFITVFCHYMIKVIVGRVGALWQGQYSPPVINQWFPLMIRECVDGFLCKCLGYTVQLVYLIYSMWSMEVAPRNQNVFNKAEMYRSTGQKSHLKYETWIWRNAVLSFCAFSCMYQQGNFKYFCSVKWIVTHKTGTWCILLHFLNLTDKYELKVA